MYRGIYMILYGTYISVIYLHAILFIFLVSFIDGYFHADRL